MVVVDFRGAPPTWLALLCGSEWGGSWQPVISAAVRLSH